jgi:hypothetical protein
VQDSVDVPLVIEPRVMLVGDIVQVRPVDGETTAVSETVPVKPLKPETAIVDVPAEPDETATLAGVAVTLKSWTVKVTIAL